MSALLTGAQVLMAIAFLIGLVVLPLARETRWKDLPV